MQPQDDRPLWDLLGCASETSPSAAFTNNVLRRIREENTVAEAMNLRLWLAKSWKMIGGLSACAALLVLPMLQLQLREISQTVASKEMPDVSALIAAVPISELAVLGEMDTTLDDNDIWLGTEPY